MEYDITKLINKGKRLFVFMGITGSGKSEIAINLALELSLRGKNVRLFDMDQTKATFRSREMIDLLRDKGVMVEYGKQLLDSPIIPDAILDKVKEPDVFTIMDIGGGVSGAASIRQFADEFKSIAANFLVINTYRPFFSNPDNLIGEIDKIVSYLGLEKVKLISNPNMGQQTTFLEVIKGHDYLKNCLEDSEYEIEFLVVTKNYRDRAIKELPKCYIYTISRYLKTAWE